MNRFHSEVARAHTLEGPEGEKAVVDRWRGDRVYRWAQAVDAWLDAGRKASEETP